jgi:sulfate/thiosulfate transport system ATP-binding protein
MSIAIRNVSKRFGTFEALKELSLDIEPGELVALLGPSGCGKTTLLRIIAGLESPDLGNVLFNDEDATALHARERNVGFVFQHYALFRHLTVFENVAFGLRVKPRAIRPPEAEIRARVGELLELVQLGFLAGSYPRELSGGQRQRIALARALAVEPRVLLLDEPFGALDARVRKELRRWLRRLHDELHVTSIFVTHDQEEALEVADRVVLMNAGRIEQVGSPDEIWAHPASPFVCSFLGDVNVFHGRTQGGAVDIAGRAFESPPETGEGDGAVAYVRPHEFDVMRHAPGEPGIVAQLSRVTRVGPTARLVLAQNDEAPPIEAHLPAEHFDALGLSAGELVTVRPKRARIFAAG